MRIIVDIDNTLWDFAAVLYERLRGYGVPEPGAWRWDFWTRYMPADEFMAHIDAIHEQQGEEHLPYPDSREFLRSLKRLECHIVMASHREPERYQATRRWLDLHGLVFDELYVGPDKTQLFAGSCAVIDDSADTLDKAAEKNLIRAGLRHAWNEGSGHPLFENLTELLGYVEQELPACRPPVAQLLGREGGNRHGA